MLLPQYDVPTPTSAGFVSDPSEFLRVENGCDTSVISLMEMAAGRAAEAYLNQVLRVTTFQGLFPCLFRSSSFNNDFLCLERFPVTAVSLVEIDENGTFSTVSDAITTILRPRTVVQFPTSADFNENNPYPIRVTFTAGYTAQNLPKEVDQAIKHYIGYLYENRGDVAGDFDDGMPDITKRLLDTVRLIPGLH